MIRKGAAPLTSRLVAKGRAAPAVSAALRSLVSFKPAAPRSRIEPKPVQQLEQQPQPKLEQPPTKPEGKPQPERTVRTRRRGPRTRVSFRIDPERHLKLRLLAAHLRRRVQEVLIAAIDLHLDEAAELIGSGRCTCLDKGRGCSNPNPPEGCSRSNPQP